jgi:hypothetical protein
MFFFGAFGSFGFFSFLGFALEVLFSVFSLSFDCAFVGMTTFFVGDGFFFVIGLFCLL